MNRKYEIDVFLKRLVNIYVNNPNLVISGDTIYDQLRLCRINNGVYEYIENVVNCLFNELDDNKNNSKSLF